jgi:cytoskeletal protein CcmA (bactofilin family)
MDTSANVQGSGSLSISTISEDLTITGNVRSKGELHLNGRVQGDVHCVALVLGENAQLDGSVIAEDLIIRGRLIGSVRALRVTLQAKSHVEGKLLHKSLSIEHGTHFYGESRPSEDPLSSGPGVPAAEPHPNNGRADALKQHEPGNGFITSLPESLTA